MKLKNFQLSAFIACSDSKNQTSPAHYDSFSIKNNNHHRFDYTKANIFL